MAEQYDPDESKVHQDYIVKAEKEATEGWSKFRCQDWVDIRIHSKAEAERIIDFLKGLGFQVKFKRVTASYLLDEDFPEA